MGAVVNTNMAKECVFKMYFVLLQFALSPSDFSSVEILEEELEEAASRGVKIVYNFPWGQEPLEMLWSRGDTELLQTHKGVLSKLQVSKMPFNMPLAVLWSTYFYTRFEVPAQKVDWNENIRESLQFLLLEMFFAWVNVCHGIWKKWYSK